MNILYLVLSVVAFLSLLGMAYTSYTCSVTSKWYDIDTGKLYTISYLVSVLLMVIVVSMMLKK